MSYTIKWDTIILRQTLPPFMVPSYIEPLDAIPLLPSDKADRKALPAPVRGRVGVQTTEYVAPVTPTETALAEVLAEVMNLDRVSVTADFFAGLGGNSLVMARFAAAVRSRLGMSGFALKDLYKHPDIRSFARQLDNSGANRPPHRRSSDARQPSDWAYWGTGLYQILASFGYLTAVAWVTLYGMAWTFQAETAWDIFGHAVAFSTLSFLFMSLLPVAAKWLLIGTWRPSRIRIWTLAYCRFWTVKTLIRTSPLGMIPGTPLFTLYLKLLGAKVAWSALVQSPAPVVSDLFEVGENAVIGRDVLASGYVAEDGFIYTGAVKVGAGAFVGDGCVLGINTAIGHDTELGHASAMYDGQKLDDGTSYAGSPAAPCTDRFQTMEAKRLSVGRRALHAGLSLAMAVGVVGPIGVFTMQALYVVEGNDPSKGAPTTLMGDTTLDALPTILAVTGALFVGGLLLMMASTLIIPRLAYLFLKPGEIYPLFGARHFAASIVYRFSNSKFLNGLFGDSSYIVPWLRAVGYRINGQHNTGSNFGMVQKHDVPYLCSFGEGTMVSDGLTMTNADFSASHFRLGTVSFGANSFLGNSIIAPTGMALGDNVLLATKVQVPVHREVVSETGLLGSPAFAIPRDHGRSQDFAQYADPKTLAKRLTLKNRYNLVSMALFLMHHWGRLAMVAIVAHIIAVDFGLWSATGVALISLASLVTILLWGVLVEALAMGFKRLKPQYCSIYDSYFWWHERYWKLSSQEELQLLNGTPFKPLFWRMLGVKFGRYVFDDGLSLTEKTLCSVGDLVTCNQRSTMQPHSLEDGAFQSGPISVGDGAILGVKSFIHYGATVGAGVQVAADSFVMKGEQVPVRSVWFGNPAQEAAAPITLSHVEAKVPVAVRSLENA